MTVYEHDDLGLRIIGYNQGVFFYDPTRALRCELYLGADNALHSSCGTIVGGGGGGGVGLTPASADLLYVRLDGNNWAAWIPAGGTQSLVGSFNLAGVYQYKITGRHALSMPGAGNLRAGEDAGFSLTTGSNNTMLGARTGYAITTADGGIYLGSDAGYYETAANKLFIDNAQRASEADGRVKALIYGIFAAATANQYLTVNGNFIARESITLSALTPSTVVYADAARALTSLANAAGGLTNNGAGVLTWVDYLTDAEHTLIGDAAPHHAAVTLDANAGAIFGLTGQQVTLDTQAANRVLAGPATGAAAVPTFRAMVAADLPSGGWGSGTAGRVAQWAAGGATLETANLIGPAANVLTFAAAAPYTLTVPATGPVAMLNQANSFTLINPLTTIAESWIGPSSTTGIYFKGGKVGMGTTSPGANLHVASSAVASIYITTTDAVVTNTPSIWMANTYAGAPNYGGFGLYTDNSLRLSTTGSFATAGIVLAVNGNVGIGPTVPLAKAHIDQSSLTGALPVLLLDQGDDDETMIEFTGAIGTGNVIEAVGAKTLTTTHFLKVEITGVGIRYMSIGTIA